ncbi:unnamed protein product, partial [Hymenolepis diminuta]
KILVDQQLEAHRRKINSAKACVDDRAPRSLFTNPKAKIYTKRRDIKNLNRIPARKPKLRSDSDNKAFICVEDPVVNNVVQTLLNIYNGCDKNKIIRRKTVTIRKPLYCSPTSKSMCKLRQSMQGPSSDILSLHSSLFTEERNFCPRTLKSAASSRVRDLACYNPPKPKLSGECDFGKSRVNKDGNAHESNGRKIFDGPTRLNSPQSVKKSPKKTNSTRSNVGHFPHTSRDDLELLRFASEITNEIIRKKQFSNSQLMVVFRSHLDRSDLKITRKDRLKSIQQIAKQLNIPSKLIKELSSSICQPQNADSAFNKSRSVERIDGGQIAESNAVSTGRKWSTEKSKSHHQSE